MLHLPDGGRISSAVPAQSLRRAPYLVRLIKPNLIASHDCHVQPICQRSLRYLPEQAVWIEASTLTLRLSSNLLRPPFSASLSGSRRFCANLLRVSDLTRSVNLNSSFLYRASRPFEIQLHKKHSGAPRGSMPHDSRAQNIKERPALNARAHAARRSLHSWVVQWLVLCGIPNRGTGALASPDPANQLPFSLFGQAIRPPGGSTAHLQLSKSSISHSMLQTLALRSDWAAIPSPATF